MSLKERQPFIYVCVYICLVFNNNTNFTLIIISILTAEGAGGIVF